MANVAYAPFALNDATLQFGADTFQDAVNRAEFVPSYQNESYDTINGVSHAIPSSATWVLNLDFGQDWVTSASLSNYLALHDGETVEVVLTSSSDGKTATADVLIRAGAFGGVAKRNATATVQLPVDGAAPVFADVP